MKKVPAKKCKECGQQFTPRFTSFQKTCNEPVCIAAHGKKVVEKERAKNWSIEKKERSEKIKTHGEYESELQVQINKIVRLIDRGAVCISCQKHGKMDAGHRFSVGGNNTLRYNTHGIWGQCFQCNDRKSGNLDGYDEGLRNTFGKEYWEYVYFDLKRTYPVIKLTKDELIDARTTAMQIVKELTKLELEYPPLMRLRLRDEINTRIGIYTKPFKDSEK